MTTMSLSPVRRRAVAGAAFLVTAPTATLALAADAPAPATTSSGVATLRPGIGLAPTMRAAGRAVAERRVLRVARRLAAVRGQERVPARLRRSLDGRSVHELADLEQRLRRSLRAARERQRTGGAPGVAIPPQLAAIAACESGGNPRAIGGGGAFRGKYQFTYSTWAAVGGSGDPAAAPEVEQDRRAAMLYARAGAGQWPVCGR